jgi:GDP-L-fucose synthase
LWIGYPEETYAPYEVAKKKAMLIMIQAYRQQFDLNGIFLLPVNLYGPYDNFDVEHLHVIPALIRKFVEAKERGDSFVTLWGDGSPTREPVNLGRPEAYSIKDLAELIRRAAGFEGSARCDTSRPICQARRKLDVSKAEELFGFRSAMGFEQGLKRTIEWWKSHRSE